MVAEEVRKLAEDSNVAAKNIASLASQITGDLDKIVEFAQENTSDSNKAKDLSAETESAIENMITFLRDIASSPQDLAAVAQEQAASSEEEPGPQSQSGALTPPACKIRDSFKMPIPRPAR